MTSLDDLALFVAIVDAGSLAAAARTQGLPKSSVTRRLARLEARLDVRLLQRNTRQLTLTETGRRLYERSRPLIAQAQAAEAEIANEPVEPHGLLRITATGAFGRLFIAPLLAAYLREQPLVNAELALFDRSVNLVEEGFDLAIRMGPLMDSGLIQRKLTDIPRLLCASPDYLAGTTPVSTLDDLKHHAGLVTAGGNRWSFEVDGRTLVVTPSVRLTGNQLEVLHAAALGGCGVALLPDFLVADDMASRRLVQLLPEIPAVPGAASALWPSNLHLPARTRNFIDFLFSRLGSGARLDRVESAASLNSC